MNTTAGRTVHLDILKLISCLGVIVIHVSGQGVVQFSSDSFEWLSCTLWDSLARFAVPVFFMCTGALMLRPERELTVRTIYKKYFLRILWILLFWAWAYYIFTVLGQYVMMGWYEPHGFLNSIRETLRFNHHLHLYYLQILLLVYAVLPILRVFTRASTEKEQNYAVLIWLILGIALPLLRKYYPMKWFGGMIGDYAINMTWSAIGYALLGWIMNTRPIKPSSLPKYWLAFAAGLVITCGGTVLFSRLSQSVNLDFMEGMSPGPALMSIGIFGAVRIHASGKSSTPRLYRLVKASFCVYLIHHFFIMVFRYVGFDVTLFAPILEIPVETAVVFVLSLAGWWVLDKIPFVNKHLI